MACFPTLRLNLERYRPLLVNDGKIDDSINQTQANELLTMRWQVIEMMLVSGGVLIRSPTLLRDGFDPYDITGTDDLMKRPGMATLINYFKGISNYALSLYF